MIFYSPTDFSSPEPEGCLQGLRVVMEGMSPPYPGHVAKLQSHSGFVGYRLLLGCKRGSTQALVYLQVDPASVRA